MQRALRRDVRVELSQGSGCSVARIGEDLLAGFLLALVQGAELRLAHEHLAANLEHGGRTGGEGFRDIADGLQVAGDVFTLGAVAPGRALHECAVLIVQGRRQAVDLGLGDESHGGILAEAEKAPDAGDEVRHILVREGVGQGQHRLLVPDLGETGGRRGANPFRRAVRADQVREGFFECLVPAAQRVIIRVADLRRVFLVVELVVLLDLGGEDTQLEISLVAAQGLNRFARVRGSHARSVLRLG